MVHLLLLNFDFARQIRFNIYLSTHDEKRPLQRFSSFPLYYLSTLYAFFLLLLHGALRSDVYLSSFALLTISYLR